MREIANFVSSNFCQMKKFLLLITLLAGTMSEMLHAKATIIPQPVSYQERNSLFTINSSASIRFDANLRSSAEYLAEFVALPIKPYNGLRRGDIILLTNRHLATEEYILDIGRSCVIIQGGSAAGVHNGIESLLQLLPPEVYTKRLAIPQSVGCVRVEDKPRYSYRGFMLDVTRTWMDVEELKHFIETLAHHKINRLHLHLSDDEGWRIEILSHPELTSIGAYRGGDSPVMPRYGKWSEKYGGYYTQAQMREVVAFASQRNIEIIPEIDLPGHSHNIARVKPEILCRYTPSTTASAGYDTRGVFCVSKEDNYALLEDIFSELAEIFPSPYIHIGGDEVSTSQWQHCPDCMALYQREGMGSHSELQLHFMLRLEQILHRLGKKCAVWNEAVKHQGLDRTTRVHCWESVAECHKVLNKGYRAVVQAGEFFYFDMQQGPREGGHNWAGVFDAKKTYSFFSQQTILGPYDDMIEGVEAAFFSEAYLSNRDLHYNFLHYQTYPRICALSEVAWSADGEWENFYSRLTSKHYQRMDNMGLSFRIFPPKVSYADGKLKATNDDNTQIYYKQLGETEEHLYTKPITTSQPELYSFYSRLSNGISPEAGVPERFSTLRPKVTITSSLNIRSDFPMTRAESYASPARTTRAAKAGDWVLYSFDAVQRVRHAEFHTGTPNMPRFVFREGYVELSEDGVNFTRVAELKDGGVVFDHEISIRSLRIVCTADANGASYCLIQPAMLWPVL